MRLHLQAQLVVLASQISWSESVDAALTAIANQGGKDFGPMNEVLATVDSTLNILAYSVLCEQPPVLRKKLEHLVYIVTVLITLKFDDTTSDTKINL